MSTFDGRYDVPPLQILAERQRSISRTIGDFVKWRREVDKDRVAHDLSIEGIAKDVADIREDLKVVKRLMISLLVAATTGSVGIIVALALSTGLHP